MRTEKKVRARGEGGFKVAKIKICGLFRDCDIDYINEAMPDYAGFILHFPKSHRNVDPVQARKLRERLRPEIKAVGVFVDQPEQTVLEAVRTARLDVIQLHGHEDSAYIQSIKEKTGKPVWKAFKVRTALDLDEARVSAADEVLLDNGYGTGESFDWAIAGEFGRRYVLAGGLTPENIQDAVRLLQPAALDLSSGVETNRVKDRKKILAAVRAARNE